MVKIALIYPYIVNPVEAGDTDFPACAERFARTYREFPPGIAHQLYVVCCNGPRPAHCESTFADLNPEYREDQGQTFDNVVHVRLGSQLAENFVVGTSSRVYFAKAGWLRRLAEVREQCGDGLFGAFGSYEHCPLWQSRFTGGNPNPHLRSVFYGTSPALLRAYPWPPQDRKSAYGFECGDHSFTRWIMNQNLPCLLVTWDGVYEFEDWRKPPNIFRRGDQSNCLVRDKHSLIYEQADAATQQMLAQYCGG